MQYCYLTDCANLSTPFPKKNEKIQAEINNFFSTLSELKKFLIEKCWYRENISHQPTFIDDRKEFYIDNILENLINNKLNYCNKLTLNHDCCRIFIYPTNHPNNVLLTYEEILTIFPKNFK